MKNAVEATNTAYDIPSGAGPVQKILLAQRRKMFDAFMAFQQGGRILSVGMSPTNLIDKPDYLFAWSNAKDRARITPYTLEPATAGYVGKEMSELRLPFADNEFDWVFCNECIEHAGSADRQAWLVRELYRVARKGVFATTSNRKHPIEFNTSIPFIHMLSGNWWRRLLRWTGKGRWASTSVLNLVDGPTLYRFAEALPGRPEHDVGHKRVFGVKAHFFLMIRKPAG